MVKIPTNQLWPERWTQAMLNLRIDKLNFAAKHHHHNCFQDIIIETTYHNETHNLLKCDTQLHDKREQCHTIMFHNLHNKICQNFSPKTYIDFALKTFFFFILEKLY
jgi:hypothetical protein